jgi:uncharacterized membrane protein
MMGDNEKRSEFLTLAALPALAASGCFLLLGLRLAISGKAAYQYLVWNLTLAMVPYLVAAVGAFQVARAPAGRRRSLMAVAVAVLWLVFYPNAPYIFTDFIHLINRTFLKAAPSQWLGLTALLWYDLLMNAAFAFIAHFIGLVSMWLIQAGLARAWGAGPAKALVGAAILFSGFGIYLGRFSRLNSWDLILDPRRVFGEVAEATADPKAMLFSAAFSLFILLSYAALVVFKRITLPEQRGRKDGACPSP